jgi:hypothetical protein
MENAVKNTIMRILVSAVIFALIAGIVVTIVGLVRDWKTPTQFSDGYFWAGAILISLGVLSVMGGRYYQPVSGLETSQSAVPLDMAERSKQLASDITRGYNLLAFLGITGLLLLGMSGLALLVGRLF